MNLEYLDGYWQRALRLPGAPAGAVDLDHTLLCGLRVGLLDTLRFLAQRPSYADFEHWIAQQNGGPLPPTDLERLRRALAGQTVEPEVSLDGVEGLTPQEVAHWDEHGYVILRQAVPLAQAQAAATAIYDFLGASPDEPASWYWGRQSHTIWVSLLQHPAFWANRRSPRIVKAFAQLWGRQDLWVTVDQGGLNPPETASWKFPGPHLHWDTTLAEPHHFGIQGILYLADCAANQGATTCIPGFHRTLKPWLAALPPGTNPREAIFGHPGAQPVAANAGDMVLWHHLLPHGSSPNHATTPRVAQYINMKPTRWDHHNVWL